MKHAVNFRDLRILSEFYWVSRQENLALREVYPNDAAQVKEVIARYVKPRIQKVNPPTLKESLRYYLNTGQFPVDKVYYAHEPVFDHPADPMNYYKWAWEVLYPDEKWTLESLDDYEEVKTDEPI